MATAEKEDKVISVVAIGDYFGKEKGEVVGYCNHKRIRVGEKFRIAESQFSKKWMARLSDKQSREVVEEEEDLNADRARKRKKAQDDSDSVI